MMRYLCCDERRRAAIIGRPGLNAIAWLDVVDTAGDPLGPMLTTLVVHFVNPAPIPPLAAANVVITGGASITGIGVVSAVMRGPIAGVLDAPALVVTTDRAGDFSIYQLRVVAGAGLSLPPPGLDSILNAIDFSFRIGCAGDFDLAPAPVCPPDAPPAPPIDYLARDYTSIRQVLLDRMAVLKAPLPANDEVDLGVTLVELLAYAGDQLSYRQDAIATEATLQTARQRISARRHARLVDYVMHNGCNARAWVVATLRTGATLTVPAGTQLLTAAPAIQGFPRIAPGDPLYATALAQGAQVFEVLAPVSFDQRLDAMAFHAWGGEGCCLPQGATSATLRGNLAAPGLLAPGRVIVLQEMVDPRTGDAALADPAHRWAVRLVSAVAATDPIGGLFLDPPTTAALAVTEIAWAADDALPFPLCISTEADADEGVPAIAGVSAAFGNVLLADHGFSLAAPEIIGTMPQSTAQALAAPQPAASLTDADEAAACGQRATVPIAARFNPVLAQGPLTHAVPFAVAPGASAASLLSAAPADALPAILSLTSADPDGGTTRWSLGVPDLIGAEAEPLFVVEVDNALRGSLRFGDGFSGARPAAGAVFSVRYRVGSGTDGNVGAGSIACMVIASDAVVSLANPLPATGGVDAETVEEVRRHAPAAFRMQQRAVTPQDYADQCRRYPGVQRAAAVLRWTGSWYTHFIAVDRLGGQGLDSGFRQGLATTLEGVRLAGHDLQLVDPAGVAIEVALTVQVEATYFRAAVRQALLAVLNDGAGGLFDPDGFTFGQPVYLSPIQAAVQSTPGVASVTVTTFQRFKQPATDGRAAGLLPMAASEIARLDNDPDYPDRGVLLLTLVGGR